MDFKVIIINVLKETEKKIEKTHEKVESFKTELESIKRIKQEI